MISKRRFVSKLKELNYVFKEQLHYQDRYRLRGETHIIHVPRRDQLEEEYVVSTLKQTGQTRAQIEQFLNEAKA